jgi:DNA-binding response OmpR family regulator
MTLHDRSPRVLVVDDEAAIRAVVRGFLERDGLDVSEAGDGPSAVDAARAVGPDVIVLDVMLPGFDGLEVLRQVRAFSDPMVVLLTARTEEVDRIVGLRVGADDYVTKPFSAAELAARVGALMRRRRAAPATAQGAPEGLVLDTARRLVSVDGERAELTMLEFDILAALARDPGVVLTRQQLLDAAWGDDWVGDEHVLDVHVANLRRKLGDDPSGPRFVETVRGVGYRLRTDAQ